MRHEQQIIMSTPVRGSNDSWFSCFLVFPQMIQVRMVWMNTVKLNLPLWSVDLHFFHRPSNFLWGGPLRRFEHATHQHLISLWGHHWQWWWWSWGWWRWRRSTNKEVLKVNEGGWTTREADGFLKSIFRGHIWTRIGFDSLGWDLGLTIQIYYQQLIAIDPVQF